MGLSGSSSNKGRKKAKGVPKCSSFSRSRLALRSFLGSPETAAKALRAEIWRQTTVIPAFYVEGGSLLSVTLPCY